MFLMKSYIKGSRQVSNVLWALLISSGGLGFFLSGLSSFFRVSLLNFVTFNQLNFIPQGIVLVFYGTLGLILGIFFWLTIWWNVGFGYNEYSKENQTVTLYRKGFPGKNRELYLKFNFDRLESIKLFRRTGLNPKHQVFLCLTDNRKLPLTGVEADIKSLNAPNKIETEALNLAKYLKISLEIVEHS